MEKFFTQDISQNEQKIPQKDCIAIFVSNSGKKSDFENAVTKLQNYDNYVYTLLHEDDKWTKVFFSKFTLQLASIFYNKIPERINHPTFNGCLVKTRQQKN